MKIVKRNFRLLHEKLIEEAIDNVIMLEANINYTVFLMSSGKKRIMSYTLGMYGLLLSDKFLRVNRSCIINQNFISNFDSENKLMVLKNGTNIKVSRRRLDEVKTKLVV
ncbi:MAG: LytTR family transcriptional regulator DNA-binding domain-containing protein [Cytophagaceae bacterium]|nr:LytTR family transcriptional regulator DNA-binding domain-containing protein [Cytophagaceae bacterium]MBK9510460.1 LytTR family transcriptional regulator DNA-binding domain-containing protein [Cytophagaceae bacterium]MBK9935940.1 LytTR family transcriptional regulator DNA-binding domain-containing protein [Cytophagaceae bacterium]MBL0326989.1 LytTR family transcriptional regulator DNA-binding domain-containing protein [Cytophagaceae bacterium]